MVIKYFYLVIYIVVIHNLTGNPIFQEPVLSVGVIQFICIRNLRRIIRIRKMLLIENGQILWAFSVVCWRLLVIGVVRHYFCLTRSDNLWILESSKLGRTGQNQGSDIYGGVLRSRYGRILDQMTAQVVFLFKFLRAVFSHHNVFVHYIDWPRLATKLLSTLLFLTPVRIQLLRWLTGLFGKATLSAHVDFMLLVHVFEYFFEGWVPDDFVTAAV